MSHSVCLENAETVGNRSCRRQQSDVKESRWIALHLADWKTLCCLLNWSCGSETTDLCSPSTLSIDVVVTLHRKCSESLVAHPATKPEYPDGAISSAGEDQ